MTKLNTTNINTVVLAYVVLTAKAAVRESKLASQTQERWIKAIDRAHEELLENPWYEFENGVLLLSSASSGEFYTVAKDGRHTGCKAAEIGYPCRHRSMRRLLELYLQTVALPYIPKIELDLSTPAGSPARPQASVPSTALTQGESPPAPVNASQIPAGGLVAPLLTTKGEFYGGVAI